MAVSAPAPAAATRPAAHGMRRFQWASVLSAAVRNPRGLTGVVLTTAVVLVAVIGPFVAPYPSNGLETVEFARPSAHFLLGSDFLGRDVLSRVLNGGWLLLVMALAATAIGVAAGAMAGMSAAYLRGPDRRDHHAGAWTSSSSFPQIVFALLLLSLIGPKLWLIVLAVGISHAPQVARVIRSATLDISERDYVKAVELQGMPPTKIMRREILPNLIAPLMVEAGLRLTYSIVIMAGLAFLGFGQPPPAASWGTMINENRVGLALNPWSVIVSRPR